VNAPVADFVVQFDAFMATIKRIRGSDSPPVWGPGFTRYEQQMLYPLEVAGELPGAHLSIIRFPRERALKFRLGLLYGGMVCRLDYTDETHVNSLAGAGSGIVPPVVSGPHYHSWPLNRRFFHGATKPPRLHDATPYNHSGRSFDGILRWFCADTMIESLPANHRIELPPPDVLL
jgi:hypothetical protein